MAERKPNPVRILTDILANRIAAGEVVERPASVVKELLENALDAGAKRLTIDIEGAGKKKICIADDGMGMDRDDALLAVERHATSKIKHEDDLFSIRTLGFRGEALPSIASVSLFKLSCRRDETAGVRVTIEGGKLKNVQEIGFPRGCEVEVRELFYNTPARRKFMKADSTELAAISEVVWRVALSRPDVRILYTHNGRKLLNLEPTSDLHERAAGVFGKDVYPKLFPVAGELGEFKLSGMVSAPDTTRPNPSQLHLFLNGRAIRDRSLLHAVTSSYGTMLEPKRFPVAVLLLEMPSELVDVNVHPAKTEVRFSNQRVVYNFIKETVREALGRSPWLGGSGTPGGYGPKASEFPSRVMQAVENFERNRSNQSAFPIAGGYAGSQFHSGGTFGSQSPNSSQGFGSYSQPIRPTGGMTNFSSFTVLAQLHKTFILVSTPRGLGIIDQHAAHERIAFERLSAQYRNRRIERQMLLFPVRIDLNPRQKAAMLEFTDDIHDLGFELEDFGGDSIQVKEAPEILAGGDIAATVRDLLDDFAEVSGSRAVQESVDHRLATMACHSVVRANDSLNYENMMALLRQMDEVDFAASCPHGRPVFIEITQEELERRFGRTG